MREKGIIQNKIIIYFWDDLSQILTLNRYGHNQLSNHFQLSVKTDVICVCTENKGNVIRIVVCLAECVNSQIDVRAFFDLIIMWICL